MPNATSSHNGQPLGTREIEISVLAPAHNEIDNVRPLAEQVRAAMTRLGVGFELVIIDDGSTDQTRAATMALAQTMPEVRCVFMSKTPPGRGCGQSAALYAGVHASRGRLVAMLDADLQNDPADLVLAYELMRSEGADFVQGDRSHARRDNLVRRVGSIVGRKARLWLLGDPIQDTGCSVRLMKREIAVQLPLRFRGMHRFIPITAIQLGYKVVEMPVTHRPRIAGETKYGLGIAQRAIPGLIDLCVVKWMKSRRRSVDFAETTPQSGPSA